MSRRPPATLADYVIVGFNPALIMFLIGSLVFFLLEVFYRGEHGMRVSFVFAMFIMGAVAVCRISMEEGTGYAASFGGPLGLVALLAISRFGEFHGSLAAFSLLINMGIIALIWFLAYQLTWDCTLLDERADTSDQGLLQAVGLQRDAATDDNTAEDPLDPQFAARDDELQEETPGWMKWFERSKQPHAHGVWVIYFSLGALPLFGLGQWFLPPGSRTYSFGLLVVYVATALALLMSTSFLGLRRYLRKRRLEMPVEMTASWLTVGGLMIVAVLAVCLLIPRPGAEVAVSQVPLPTFGTRDLSPSRYNTGRDGQKQDPSAQAGSTKMEKSPGGNTGQTSGSGDQKGPDGQGGQKSESGSSGGQPDKSGQAGNQKTSDKSEQTREKSQNPDNSGQPNQTNSGQPQQPNNAGAPTSQASPSTQQSTPQNPPQQNPSPPRSFSPASFLPSLGNLFKLLMYLAIAALLAFLAWKYRRELLAAWQQLLKELREFWERWFGRGEATAAAEAAAAPAPPRPFAAYSDPFVTGQAGRVSRVELLRYTFEALQAWGRENNCRRDASETPHEYVQRLATYAPHLAQEAALLAEHYGRAAYARGDVPASVAEPLRTLWSKLQHRATAVV